MPNASKAATSTPYIPDITLDRRLYLVARLNQVLHEGGEFHGAVNLARGDDRADAAASCQEAAVDETL